MFGTSWTDIQERKKHTCLRIAAQLRLYLMYVVDITYSTRAPNTKRIQASIQASMAVRPSALGVLVVTLLKMLTSTRKRVTNRAILPGITSIGIRKDIHETITNSPKQKQFAAIWLVLCLLCLLVIGFT